MTFTKVPNEMLDKMAELKDGELRIVLAVIRQTIGHQKEWDWISTSRFQQLTGLSHQGVLNALASVNGRWIERRERKNSYEYRLNLVNNFDQTKEEQSTESVNIVDRKENRSTTLTNPVDQNFVNGQHSVPKSVNNFDTQKKKEIKENQSSTAQPSDRDGRWLLQKLEEKGFVYKDTKWRELSIKLESDYDDTQLLQALTVTAEAHQKKINAGERGITAPMAYMQMVLTAKPQQAQPQPETPVRKTVPYRGMQVLS